MPAPGVPNNPSGVNSFDHFAPEPAYGEGTKQKALAGGAPLAGGQVAAGQLNAAKTAQRQAVRGPKRPQPSHGRKGPAPQPAPLPPDQPPTAPMSSAATWAAIAAEPGAAQYPILGEMAAKARG